jgi:hypothetical protein
MPAANPKVPDQSERTVTLIGFCLLLAFHIWGVSVGWTSLNLPGNEFRQTQTAMTALYVQREHNFSLAYPTPVLGKPWSIPFEFPLYQWSAVWLSNATGMPLTQAGRAVSLICFYLSLPPMWLLLGRLGVIGTRRLVVLGMVLICPLYVFYARAFLIETMALMFSLWFLYAYVTTVEHRSWAWLAIANLAGALAGLVKITTFMVYLMPAGLWSLWCLWRSRPRETMGWLPWLRTPAWMVAATAIPFVVSDWWIVFTDRLRTLNPGSRSLVSASLKGYTFGTWQTRLSPDVWTSHWQIVLTNLVSLPVLVVAAVVALIFAGCWRRWSLWCFALFIASQALFPVLYAWHEYYYVANGVLLTSAVGFAFCGLLESATWRWVVCAIILGVCAGQIHLYRTNLYPGQRQMSYGSDLDVALRNVTHPDDVLVVAGEDWASMIPYYTQRRALMIRLNMENDWPFLNEAFGKLKGERVGALVLRGAQQDNAGLRDLAARYFDLDPVPAFSSEGATVYLNRRFRGAALAELRTHRVYSQVELPANDARDEYPMRGRVVPVSDLLPGQLPVFQGVSPLPDRFYSTFGLNLTLIGGRPFFTAHPDTRIWLKVPPGRRRIAFEFDITPGAYEGLRRDEATDGVEFSIGQVDADGSRVELFRRLLNPFAELRDRGVQKMVLAVDLPPDVELLFATGPGSANNYTRDWAEWGPITIK